MLELGRGAIKRSKESGSMSIKNVSWYSDFAILFSYGAEMIGFLSKVCSFKIKRNMLFLIKE
jgi:hypothetical protein